MCHKTNTYPANGALALRRLDPLSVKMAGLTRRVRLSGKRAREENRERGIVTGTSGEFAWQASDKSAMEKRARGEAADEPPGVDGRATDA